MHDGSPPIVCSALLRLPVNPLDTCPGFNNYGAGAANSIAGALSRYHGYCRGSALCYYIFRVTCTGA